MKSLLLLLLTLCALSAAMVPFHRVRRDDKQKTETEKQKVFCAPTTPCSWTLHGGVDNDNLNRVLGNSYCECAPGTECIIAENDMGQKVSTHRCINNRDKR